MIDELDDAGYDVEEIGAAAVNIQELAKAKGIALPRQAAIQIATRKVLTQPRAVYERTRMQPGRGSGMATCCPLGATQFAAAAPAGSIVNLIARAEEPFTASKLIIQRDDYAVVPPAVCAGLLVLVMNVTIGMKSVLSSAAGIPVQAFDPEGTGGQTLATGAIIARSTLITIQFALGALAAVPAGEQITLSATLMGRE